MEESEHELYLECYQQIIRNKVRIPIAWLKLTDVPEYITFNFEIKKEHSTLMETE